MAVRRLDPFILCAAVVLLLGLVVIAWAGREALQQSDLAASRDSWQVKTRHYLATWVPLAQQDFKLERRLDRDGDGVGEYGSIGQLIEAGDLDPDGKLRHEQGVWLYGPYGLKVLLAGEPDADELSYRLLAFPLLDRSLHPILVDSENRIYAGPKDYDPRQPPDLSRWQAWD